MQLMFILMALMQDRVYETHMQWTHSHDINAWQNIYKTHMKLTHDRSHDTDARQYMKYQHLYYTNMTSNNCVLR